MSRLRAETVRMSSGATRAFAHAPDRVAATAESCAHRAADSAAASSGVCPHAASVAFS